MEQELKRLQVLQSYCILDSPHDEDFDRITRMVTKLLDASACFINFIDLQRQWTKSSTLQPQELADQVRTMPREESFCAHVVIGKQPILVVPNTKLDPRFQDLPCVNIPEAPLNFYAGAALIAPETNGKGGVVKLGTICIMDSKPRPEGLSTTERELLLDFAAMTVQTMVARRTRLLHQAATTQLEALGQTVLAPMTVELQQTCRTLSEAIAMESPSDSSEQTTAALDTAVTTAVSKLQVQANVCAATARSLMEKEDSIATDTTSTSGQQKKESVYEEEEEGGFVDNSTSSLFDDLFDDLDDILDPTTYSQALYDSIVKAVSTMTLRPCPITIQLTKTAPVKVTAEDLLVFRSAVALILYGMGQCQQYSTGTTKSGIQVVITTDSATETMELSCLMPIAWKPTAVATAGSNNKLFTTDPSLKSVASMVRAMNGSFGTRTTAASTDSASFILWIQLPTRTYSKEVIGKEQLREFAAIASASTTTRSRTTSPSPQLLDDAFQQAVLSQTTSSLATATGCGIPASMATRMNSRNTIVKNKQGLRKSTGNMTTATNNKSKDHVGNYFL